MSTLKEELNRAGVFASIKQYSLTEDEVPGAGTLCIFPLDVGQTKVLSTDETLPTLLY